MLLSHLTIQTITFYATIGVHSTGLSFLFTLLLISCLLPPCLQMNLTRQLVLCQVSWLIVSWAWHSHPDGSSEALIIPNVIHACCYEALIMAVIHFPVDGTIIVSAFCLLQFRAHNIKLLILYIFPFSGVYCRCSDNGWAESMHFFAFSPSYVIWISQHSQCWLIISGITFD